MGNFLRKLFKRLTTSKSKPNPFLRPPQLTYLEDRINPTPITVNTLQDSSATDAFTSLREAIDLANNTAGDDTIVFDSSLFTNGPATISLTGVLPAIADATTAGTLTITGPGANTLNINGNNGNFSIFSIVSLGNLSISGVTVSGANITSGVGGGGFINAGTLTVTNSTISGNSASSGSGGGILNLNQATVTNSTISGNSASTGSGGGIRNSGTLTVTNSTISGNSAFSGGGIRNSGSLTTTVTNSTISGNTATTSDGGGIFSQGQGTLTLTNSTLSGNTAGNRGGGLHIFSGSSTVTNSTFSGNSATTSGGGINNLGTLNIANTIIANSTSGGDFAGTAPNTNTNNLVEDGSLTGASIGDPRLGPLQNNGGPTLTMALGAGSPAIKTAAGTGTDQRGINRTTSDIGAYSFGIQVTTTAPSGTGSLDAAITQANTTPGNDQISFNLTGSSPYTITLAGALPTILDATATASGTGGTGTTVGTVTITGLGASLLTIDGSLGGFSIFNIASGGNLSISGVTVSGANISSGNGGGFNNSGTLNIANSTISGNTVGDFGGGIFNNGALTVTNSTFSGNRANFGGGVFNNSNSTSNISNSTFSGNSAVTLGGGIFNQITNGIVTLTNSTLSGNSARSNANSVISSGGIYNDGTLNIANTIIANSTVINSSSPINDYAGTGTVNRISPSTAANNIVTLDTNTNTLTNTSSWATVVTSAALKLGPLQNNGGPTFTMALLNGSAAIGAGNSTISNASPINGKDQRGINRTTSDIGSYSFGIQVINTSDVNTVGSGSLRAAINLANTTPGNDQITFNLTGSSSYTITLAGALPNIIDATATASGTGGTGTTVGTLTITGLGASALTISGDNGDSGRNFRIFNIASLGNLAISGVTVIGANFTGNGGAFNNSGTLTVTNSTLSGNAANIGGGFYNSGIATFTNSTISGNSANTGGGAGNIGTLTISNSTISGNSALNIGGALFNGLNGNLTVSNSTLSGNSASGFGGGGIYNLHTATVTNSTLSGNSAGNGGGIYNYGLSSKATLNIANTIIANSTSGLDYAGTGTVNLIGSSTVLNNLVTQTGSLVSAWATTKTSAQIKLGLLQNNGGPNFTMALLNGSAAIGAGNSTISNASPINGLDQRGFARTTSDIGSYAYIAPTVQNDVVVAVNTSGQVGLFLSSAGTAITDFHTAFAGSTLTITATRTTGTITGSGTGITIDNTAKTIAVNLTLLSVFSGIVIEGNSGADSVTIGVEGVDFSVVTGGGTDQSLVITTGTGADSLTISNAINTKGNSASAYLNSGTISGAGLVTTPTITLVANTGINVSASALAFANISTINGNIDITNTTGINLPAIAAPANLSINAGGTISQNGLITVVGLATFNAGANPITLTNPSNNFTGAVSLTNTGANNVAIRDVNTINFAASSLGSGTLSVNAVGITQSGAITQASSAGTVTFNSGAGVITLANVGNDFTGLVSLNNSGNNNVSVQDSTDLPIGLSNLGSGTLNLNAGSSGSIKIASNVTSLNGVQNYNSPIILTSNIDLNAGTGAINLLNMISGNFSLSPITANPGLTTISGANTNTTTNVTTGVVQISNTQSTNYAVSGGTLKGTGSIGNLTATGTGVISPGNSAGKITTTSLDLSSGNTLQIEINNVSPPVAGTHYDQIVVSSSGTVNLGGATLSLSSSFGGDQGTVFTIIDNQHQSASIQGTFAGLSEGGVITANGRAYKISYRGGTGSNDVTLTVYDPATVTSFSPTIGKTGTSVVITGSNFTNVSQVSFNGTVQPTYTENSPTQITTTVPSGATTGTISITTIAGIATSTSSFTVDNTAPTLSISANPGSLKANETSTITITFSEVVTGFSSSIITVTNGTLSSPVASSSTVYTAIFTPTLGIKADGTISVSNNYFDSVGNQGTAATLTPPIAINTIQTPLVTGSASTTQGGSSVVSLVDPDTGAIIGSAVPFPGFTGQIRVVSGDFNGDGKVDIIAAAGPGGGPAVAILDSETGEVLESFFAFDPAFTGGVFIAVRDFNGDGILDIIAGAGAGGGPEVRIFNGDGLTVLRSFYAYAEDFTGGVTVASIDFNNDGILDLVTGAGPTGAPHVKVYDGDTNAIISQWYAYPVSFTGGVYVAAGDIGNDGNIEVVTGAGSGGAPVVAVWDPYTGALLAQFMAYAEDFTGGVRVGVSDGNFDGVLDLITGAGPGGGPQVNGFSFPTLDLLFSFFSGDPSSTDGVFVS